MTLLKSPRPRATGSGPQPPRRSPSARSERTWRDKKNTCARPTTDVLGGAGSRERTMVRACLCACLPTSLYNISAHMPMRISAHASMHVFPHVLMGRCWVERIFAVVGTWAVPCTMPLPVVPCAVPRLMPCTMPCTMPSAVPCTVHHAIHRAIRRAMHASYRAPFHPPYHHPLYRVAYQACTAPSAIPCTIPCTVPCTVPCKIPCTVP